jgi:hypothetical protein
LGPLPDPEGLAATEATSAPGATTYPSETSYPGEGPAASAVAAAPGSDRPEIAIGAAFGGGLLLALILKRLAG